VGVLDKAMTVLRAFPLGNVALSPREVAGRTDTALPTVYRLLVQHGMLEKSGGQYRLGISLPHLGGRVAEGMEVRRQAQPHLEWLAECASENAEPHVRRKETRIPVELVRSLQNLWPIVEIGEPLPLHLGAAEWFSWPGCRRK
jgi:DNA-binding IclR family transcriptional regulator